MRRKLHQPFSIKNVRSLFISDIHLGCKHSQAEQLLEFLNCCQPEYLYLVGDIIDGRSLKRRWYWGPEFSRVLSRLLEFSHQGTIVRYAIGNHDEFLRNPETLDDLSSLGTMEIAEEFLHTTSDERQFLVIHGDRFDEVEQSAEWVSHAASIVYEGLLTANKVWSRFSRVKQRCQFSLSSRIKRGVKGIVKYISEFENKVTAYARSLKCHGVICGHIHTPVKTKINGLDYCNTGDWIENCSALVELHDGRIELVYFDDFILDPEGVSVVQKPLKTVWREQLPVSVAVSHASFAVCADSLNQVTD